MSYLDKQISTILNETDFTDIAINVGGVVGVSAALIAAAFAPHFFRKYKQTRDCKTKISMLQNKLGDNSLSSSERKIIAQELEAVKKKCHIIYNRKSMEHESFDEQCTSEVFSNLENNIKKFKENGNVGRAAQLEKYLVELKSKCRNRSKNVTELVFKKTTLNESVSNLIRQTECRRYIINEGFVDFFNYGVTVRAVDSIFGGPKKLEKLVKEEIRKKYKLKDISKLDPKEIEQEIKAKADSAAKQLASKEFINGVKEILASGLLNGIINSMVNALLTLILTFDPKKAIESMIHGFITGVLIKFLYHGFRVLYQEVKKRIYRDPYATPTMGEMIAIFILTIVTFTSAYILFMTGGTATAGQIIGAIVFNLIMSFILTAVISLAMLVKKEEPVKT